MERSILLTLMIYFILSGCSKHQMTDTGTQDNLYTDILNYQIQSGSIKEGEALFDSLCATCHGYSEYKPDGMGRLFGKPAQPPSLDDITHKGISYADDYLKTTIMYGKNNALPVHSMPGWQGVLTEQDIADLIAFIRSKAQ